jgi:hypothetical protein
MLSRANNLAEFPSLTMAYAQLKVLVSNEKEATFPPSRSTSKLATDVSFPYKNAIASM